jgi:hypothetical protein
MTNTAGIPVFTVGTGSTYTYSTTTGQSPNSGLEVRNLTTGFTFGPAALAQVNSIATQPVTLTGFALLPVFAALLFGFALYRLNKARNEDEESSESD